MSEPTPAARTATRLLAIAACTVSLWACSTAPRLEPGVDPESPQGIEARAQQHLLEGQYAEAAGHYARLASLAGDPVQAQHYALVEAEILFAHRLEAEGAQRTAALPAQMPSNRLQARRQLLQSAADLHLGRPRQALLALPDPRLMGEHNLLLRYHDLRFRAGTALNESQPVFDSLIALDQLEDGEHRELRNNQIWQLLSSRDELAIEQLEAGAGSTVHAGWLALRRAVHDPALDPRSSLATWRQRFATHPAQSLLQGSGEDLRQLAQLGVKRGQISLLGNDSIALLLPFDKRLAKFSNAIRDGLLSAMYDSGQVRQISIYDVGANPGDAVSAYQRAVADGAQLVIGPLRRSSLDALARYADFSVPVIALNYLADGGTDNLIQFGLSPEDEARDAVSYMMQAGLRSAAMILPDTEAGARSGEAFRLQLERWGGEVVATQVLDSSRKDYRKELSALLLTNDSLQRRRNIQAALDTNLVFETQTRNDLDAIFAPVSPPIGRVLKPQLDFHGATRIPLLASSSIYSGKPRPERDGDLDGTLFNDIPWLIAPRLGSEGELQQTAAQLELDSGPLARFFALGVDAYRVSAQLGAMLEDSDYAIEGATGRLQLSPERRIRRQLAWAVFEGGRPKPVRFAHSPLDPPPAEAPVDGLLPPLPYEQDF